MAESEERRSARGGGRGERLVSALDQRLPVSSAGKEFLRKSFPDHWSFLLGELALYSLMVLVLTGVWLTFLFHPDMTERPYTGSYAPLRGTMTTEAYASVLHISFDVRGGLPMRQMRHWAALVFVAAIGVHLLRVFFTGAFRRPREVTWTVGVTLFLFSLLEGFCGYSLPDETTAEVRRTAGGGYEEAHTLLSREDAYRILVRDTPRPRGEGTQVWRWFHRHRLRNALSRWYFGRSVEMPATAWQKRRVEFVRAAPGEVPEGGEES
ncbi:cytochrome b N-terminal domain-containing protein [Streptomyces sp. NPDC052109]|uniref:cytochrome b N-terminal domain-containing protein n=1 Tax=Streptomyces sp. NPDC052109 TaxID=3155527 RepID=UPI00342BDA23